MRLTAFTDFGLRALMRLAGEPDRSFTTDEIAQTNSPFRVITWIKVVRRLAEASAMSGRNAARAAASSSRGRRGRSPWARSCATSRTTSLSSSAFATMAATAC